MKKNKVFYLNRMNSKNGFTLIEVLIVIGMASLFLVLSLSFTGSLNSSTKTNRTATSRDRILSGIRTLAGIPAALRNSMRASAADGVTVVNPELFQCAGGTPANSCDHGVEVPLMLFSPIVAPQGATMGSLQPISSPKGSLTPLRFDSFGTPCPAGQVQDCPLLVYTSFRAFCAPPAVVSLPVGVITPGALNMVPVTRCSVADHIEVIYTVQLDPNMVDEYPSLASFTTPVEGSVVTPVILISGNRPL